MNQQKTEMSAPQANPSLAQYMDANGWIDRKVRPPTVHDADSYGDVEWSNKHGLRKLSHYTSEGAGDYWKPAGPGPVVETEEERMKREDREAFKKWSEGIAVDDFHYYVWSAALAHARKARK